MTQHNTWYLVHFIYMYVYRYGANITTVCESESPARALTGETLTVINDAMVKKVGMYRQYMHVTVYVIAYFL